MMQRMLPLTLQERRRNWSISGMNGPCCISATDVLWETTLHSESESTFSSTYVHHADNGAVWRNP